MDQTHQRRLQKQRIEAVPTAPGSRSQTRTSWSCPGFKTGLPEIDVGDSLTAFVRRIQNYRPNGQQIRAFKTHLGNLSAATIRMLMAIDNRAAQINSQIVSAFEFWFPQDDQQRILWPSTLRLGHEYFLSLQNHAVPLDERALAGLAHSALALDLYAWLAQRLHRIPREKPQVVSWAALKEQFGADYKQTKHFKAKFHTGLLLALSHYPAAKVETDGRGLTLRNSPTPVEKRMVFVYKS